MASAPVKVTLSLGGSKGAKKKRKIHTEAENLGFGDDRDEDIRREKLAASRLADGGGGPLVIPLPAGKSERSGPLLAERSFVVPSISSERDAEAKETCDGDILINDCDEQAGSGAGSSDGKVTTGNKGDKPKHSSEETNSGGDPVFRSVKDEQLDKREPDDAAAALIRAATEIRTDGPTGSTTTNFSASGSLIIGPKVKEVQDSGRYTSTSKAINPPADPRDEFRQDLDHLPDDIGVDSDAYASVPISEFGAAMLRGMGWNGDGDGNGKEEANNDDEGVLKPRHHRLGLGATPKPKVLSNKGAGGVKVGDRHRARRPSRRDLREEQQEEEEIWKKRAEENVQKDAQKTLQVGSVVRVRTEDGRKDQARAFVSKTTGVPGLNRILIQFEGKHEETSVKRGDMVLVSRDELDSDPFLNPPNDKNDKNGSIAKKRKMDYMNKAKDDTATKKHQKSKKKDKGDFHVGSGFRSSVTVKDCIPGCGQREQHQKSHDSGDYYRHTQDYSGKDKSRSCSRSRERDSRNRPRQRKRSRDYHGRDSSRSRSRSRDRDNSQRRKHRHDCSQRVSRNEYENNGHSRDGNHRSRRSERRGKDRGDDRGLQDDSCYDGRHSRKRSLEGGSNNRGRHSRDANLRSDDRNCTLSSNSAKQAEQGQEYQCWLVPHIRVRVVTKKVDRGRRYKQKGVVVEVLGRGANASLQMDYDGALLEGIAERHLETALPQTGGYVTLLVGHRRGAIGRLLERDSSLGRGTVQLIEDMDVEVIPLDDMAEWCGQVEE